METATGFLVCVSESVHVSPAPLIFTHLEVPAAAAAAAALQPVGVYEGRLPVKQKLLSDHFCKTEIRKRLKQAGNLDLRPTVTH